MPYTGPSGNAYTGWTGFGKSFDNIIVGKLLGADALASVSLGNAVFSPCLCLLWDFPSLFRRLFRRLIRSMTIKPSTRFSVMALSSI